MVYPATRRTDELRPALVPFRFAAEALNQEIDHRAHFGREMTAVRIDGVNIKRLRLERFQDCAQLARAQIVSGDKRRRQRNAESRARGGDANVGALKAQTAVDADLTAGLSLTEMPERGFSRIQIEDHFAIDEICGRLRLTLLVEIGGRCDGHDPRRRKSACDQSLVRKTRDPDRHVDALLDDVDEAIGEGDFELDLRVGAGEIEQRRFQLRSPERHRHR